MACPLWSQALQTGRRRKRAQGSLLSQAPQGRVSLSGGGKKEGPESGHGPTFWSQSSSLASANE